MLRALPLLALLLAQAGCASWPRIVAASDPVNPSDAYMLLRPHLRTNGLVKESVKLQLQKIEPDGSETAFGLNLETTAAQIVELPPGHYRVWLLNMLPLKKDACTFDAVAGHMNYPGDWWFEFINSLSHTSNVDGGFRFWTGGLATAVETRQAPDIESFYNAQYPAMAAKLPLVTRPQ